MDLDLNDNSFVVEVPTGDRNIYVEFEFTLEGLQQGNSIIPWTHIDFARQHANAKIGEDKNFCIVIQAQDEPSLELIQVMKQAFGSYLLNDIPPALAYFNSLYGVKS